VSLSLDPTAPTEGPSNAVAGFQTNDARFVCLDGSDLPYYTDAADPGELVAVGSCGSEKGEWIFSG
jgi:hypothetical protein